MTANPIELIGGLANTSNVAKADLIAWAKARVEQVLANVAEIRSTTLAGQLVVQLKTTGLRYIQDTTDTTTADDGVFCIISSDGKRFKAVFNIQAASAATLGGLFSSAAVANQFVTGLDTAGNLLRAQPAFSNISGNLSVSQLNSGTSASGKAYWSGSGLWAALNVIPMPTNGLVGDGSTDDTTAFQTLLTANGSNATIDGIGKTYKITAAVTIPAGSSFLTIQNATFSVTGDINFLSVASGSALFFEFNNVTINAPGQTTTGRKCVDVSRMSLSTFCDVWINATANKSIGFYGAGTAGASPYYNLWDHCYIGNCNFGIIFDDAAGGGLGANSNTITNTRIQPGSGNFGVYLGAFSQNTTVRNCRFESSGGTGIYMDGTGHLIDGARFESQTAGIAVLTNATNNTIGHNYYSSNTANVTWAGSSRAVNTILWDPDLGGSISSQGGVLSRNPTQGLGYATGAGGSVTQATSRTTGVTLNKVSGSITLFTAAPTVGAWVFFTVTNSTVAATDTINFHFKSGTNAYQGQVFQVFNGSFQVGFQSVLGASSDAPVINFNVFKGVVT